MLKHKIISTCLGIGYVKKGGGTVAAIVTCLAWFLIDTKVQMGRSNSLIIEGIFILGILALGIWSANKVESIWGKDNYRVVIDEVAGMAIALFGVPINWQNTLIALFLFRFFDIAKPLCIRRVEKLPGGWGVMFDDVLAGVYALIIIQIILAFHWL